VIDAIKEVLIHPDAERPYLRLAEAYKDADMGDEEGDVLFLVEKRFGGGDDNRSDLDEEQRRDDKEGP
jgi:hypothetical protein